MSDAALILGDPDQPPAWNQRFAALWDLPVANTPALGLREVLGHIMARVMTPARFAGTVSGHPAGWRADRPVIVARRDGRRLEWRSMAFSAGSRGSARRLWLFRNVPLLSAGGIDDQAPIAAQFLEAMDSIQDGVILYDSRHSVVHWNAGYLRAFPGTAARLWRGMPVTEVIRSAIAAGYVEPADFDPTGSGDGRSFLRSYIVSRSGDRDWRLADGRIFRVIERETVNGGRMFIYTDITEAKRQEAAVARSSELAEVQRKRFFDALEAMAEGVTLYGADRRLILSNSATTALFPAMAGRYIPGTPALVLLRLLHEHGWLDPGAPPPEVLVELLFDPLTPVSGREFQIRDGRWLRTLIRATAEGGRIITITDTSEERRRAAALEAAEHAASAARGQLLDAIEAMSEGVAIYDPDRRLVLSNSARRRLFPGAPRAHHPGADAVVVFQTLVEHGYALPDRGDPEGLAEGLFSPLMEREEIEYRLNDGRWLRARRRPMRGGGRITTVLDITGRKEAELALEAAKLRAEAAESQAVSAQQWLEDAINCTAEAVAIFDRNGRIALHNRQFAEVDPRIAGTSWLGTTVEEWVRILYARGVLSAPEQDLETAIRARIRAFESVGQDIEFPLTSGRWLRSTVRRMRDGGLVGLLIDISGLKEREGQLRGAMMEAQVANKSKSEFLANMSHELRTPLNAVIGFSEIMEREMLGPLVNQRYREYVGDIRLSGQHLLDLINTVLDLSRIEAGKIPLQVEVVSTKALIEGCLPLVRHRAEHAEIALVLDLADELPYLRVDLTRLRQILLNLLSNAVKFTERGGRITIRAARTEEGGVTISVADTGIGMSEGELAHAFEPFYQVEGRLTRRFEGSGLGLTLAKSLVEEHGGMLILDSELGTGTRATVHLPPSRVLPPN